MAIYSEGIIEVTSPYDLEQEMCRYNCCTEKELDAHLWLNYGVTLIKNYE